jgi:hypothetical protein
MRPSTNYVKKAKKQMVLRLKNNNDDESLPLVSDFTRTFWLINF